MLKTNKKNSVFTRHFSGSSKSGGFTIIEVLAALTILSIAVTGIEFFLASSLWSATAIKNNYIASLLTQEGLEVVRNIRDNEWFTDGTFGNSLPEGAWQVQWDTTILNQPFSNSFLKKDGNGLYNYNDGTDTIFIRRIDICKNGLSPCSVSPGIEVKVRVTVSWTEKGQVKILNAVEHLFDWKRD